MLVIEGLSGEKNRGMWNGLLQTILYTPIGTHARVRRENISCEKITLFGPHTHQSRLTFQRGGNRLMVDTSENYVHPKHGSVLGPVG
jgi:hypothetical protein